MRWSSAAFSVLLAAGAWLGGLNRAVAAEEFSVLSYNVHGLFAAAARDDPGARAPLIGWLANRYDVVILQEDFEYHASIAAQMSGKLGTRGNGMGWDPRRVAVKTLLAPFALFLPHFWPPYGAGLATYIRSDMAIEGDHEREAYGICDGWFGARADCWANKGLLRTGMRTPEGLEIDLYNTHLDAGGGKGAIEARRRQLELLGNAIAHQSPTRPVIVTGDFNMAFDRPEDRRDLTDFRGRMNLRDSGAGPEFPSWRERGYILHRDGKDVALEVTAAGEAVEFVNRQRALSDHPALYARFRARRIDGQITANP